jgi:uncharacterized membrane protein YdjX (TVP38/TMEM64 family)
MRAEEREAGTPAPTQGPPGRAGRVLRVGAFVLLAVTMIIAARTVDFGRLVPAQGIEAWLQGAGPLGPIVFILAMALAVVISPLPSLPLDIAAGSVFGPLLGTVYAVTGGLLGAVASFLLARGLGRGLVDRLVGGHVQFCRRCSDRFLTGIVFFSRLLPFVSFDVVSYGAGMTRMSLSRFALATGLGMLPLTSLYVTFGAAVVSNRGLATALGLALVAAFFLVPRWVERRDPFGLRKMLEHAEDKAAADEEASANMR